MTRRQEERKLLRNVLPRYVLAKLEPTWDIEAGDSCLVAVLARHSSCSSVENCSYSVPQQHSDVATLRLTRKRK